MEEAGQPVKVALPDGAVKAELIVQRSHRLWRSADAEDGLGDVAGGDCLEEEGHRRDDDE